MMMIWMVLCVLRYVVSDVVYDGVSGGEGCSKMGWLILSSFGVFPDEWMNIVSCRVAPATKILILNIPKTAE